MKFPATLNFFSEIDEIPPLLNQTHYPSLNGLRALAVLLVVASHIILFNASSYSMLFIGSVGVNIFFVLSGFLITTLCIKEKVLTKNLSLKNFYIRRALRIFPVAYLYIAVVLALNFILKLNISYLSFVTSALYIVDFSYFRKTHFDWELGHYWSLSVEEQFYIIFPFLLKYNFKLYLEFILFIVFGLPLVLLMQSNGIITNHGVLYAITHLLIKFQAISTGCLFSILCFKGMINFGKWRLPVTFISIFLLFYVKYDDFYSIQAVFVNLFLSAVTGFIIVSVINRSDDLLFKALNCKLVSTIGILSYSIYIWQELFFTTRDKYFFNTLPFNLLFIAVVPCLSYYLYEKKFLKLKARFAKVKSIYQGP